MNIHDWKFVKRKSGLFKKTKWKEKKNSLEKNGLEQKKKMNRKKKKERKEVEVQFELYCVKLVELMTCEEKLCSTSL